MERRRSQTISLSQARLKGLLARMKGTRVLVAGDLILDEYLEGDARRISPEAPIPVLKVEQERRALGGAAYVAALAAAFGGQVTLAGVLGEDEAGEDFLDLAGQAGLGLGALIRDPSRVTPVKTRLIARGQQMLRLDREKAEALSRALEQRLGRVLEEALEEVDGLLVSDYDKGTLTPRLVRLMAGLCRRRKLPWVVDPKPRSIGLYKEASILKPNQGEAEAALGLGAVAQGDFDSFARLASGLAPHGEVLVTRGPKGMALIRRGKKPVLIPTRAQEVFDETGAGDAGTAALGLLKAAGASSLDAALVANLAGALAVSRHGCWIFGAKELLEANAAWG